MAFSTSFQSLWRLTARLQTWFHDEQQHLLPIALPIAAKSEMEVQMRDWDDCCWTPLILPFCRTMGVEFLKHRLVIIAFARSHFQSVWADLSPSSAASFSFGYCSSTSACYWPMWIFPSSFALCHWWAVVSARSQAEYYSRPMLNLTLSL